MKHKTWTNSVVFKGDFRLAPAYIRGVCSSETLCAVGGKVVADVSGLTNDPFFRGRMTAWGLKMGQYAVSKSR